MRGRRKEGREGGRREREEYSGNKEKRKRRGEIFTCTKQAPPASVWQTPVLQSLHRHSRAPITTQQRQFIRNSPLTTIRTDAQKLSKLSRSNGTEFRVTFHFYVSRVSKRYNQSVSFLPAQCLMRGDSTIRTYQYGNLVQCRRLHRYTVSV